MTPPDDDAGDRDAILARRAIFLSTALAALHCSSPKEPATHGTATDITIVGSSTATATATATATGRSATVPPGSSWSETVRDAPPRGIPKSASGAERTQLEALEQDLDRRYAAVKEVWERLPDCDAADPGCRATWREVGDKMRALFNTTRRSSIGGCGGASGRTASVVERGRAHARFLADALQKLEDRLTAVAASFSPTGEQEWRRLLANAKEPPPMPCLSPCPMPEVQELFQAVRFARNASTLVEDPATKSMLDAVVATYKNNRKPSTIAVRGHADAGETKPDELAKARAAAVARWLEKAGVPRAHLRERTYAAELPVERGDSDAGASQNQRVDFEAIPQ